MLEETKKEVREIKAIESQLKWNMTKEEKKERHLEARTSVEEERDWRWRKSDEMKALAADRAQEAKLKDLKESKAFQEFKRETKAVAKGDEKRHIQQEYVQDRENAQWRAELVKEDHERSKMLVTNRVENYLEFREIRNLQKEQERFEADENRAIEQTLEMAAIAQEIAKEKEDLLRELEYSRAAQRASHRSMLCTPSATLGQLS